MWAMGDQMATCVLFDRPLKRRCTETKARAEKLIIGIGIPSKESIEPSLTKRTFTGSKSKGNEWHQDRFWNAVTRRSDNGWYAQEWQTWDFSALKTMESVATCGSNLSISRSKSMISAFCFVSQLQDPYSQIRRSWRRRYICCTSAISGRSS